MDMHNAQQKHIEKSLTREERVMQEYRTPAINAVYRLMQQIEHAPDTHPMMVCWTTARQCVSLAVIGRLDGYFGTPYPPLSELVKALFE